MGVSPSTRTEACGDGASADVSTLATPSTSLSPERLFVSLGLCFGILFAFVTPPLQIADEDSHFKKAFAVSRGYLLQQAVVDGTGPHYGNTLPRAVEQFAERHRYMIGRIDAKYRYADLYSGTAMAVPYGEKIFVSHSAGTLNALVYLPPALGMAAGRLVYGLTGMRTLYTPAAHLYFGRLFNLFFFVACVYFAIRLTPVAKNAFLVAALLPMTMHLAASLNRDAVVIAVAFLWTALVLRLARREAPIQRREKFGLVAMACVLLLGKQVYFSLVGLLLLVPAARWGSRRERWKGIGAIVAACLGLYLVDSVYVALIGRGAPSAEAPLIRQQVAYVLGHPLEFVALLATTPWKSRMGWFVMLTGNLGWLDTNFPYPFLVLLGLTLLAAALFDRGGGPGLDARAKVLAVGLGLATVIVLECVFYVLWTCLPQEGGVGANRISGIQGRYFLPLLPLALISIRNDFTARWTRAGELVELALPPLLVAAQVYTFFILLLRYWIP